jgi:hypothetical protein
MNRALKWLLIALGTLVVLLGAIVFALQRWVGSEDFRGRVAQQITDAIGVPVTLGGVGVAVWPLPAVTLEQVTVQTKPALTLERLEARPIWASLLHGKLDISTLIVRNAVVPELAVTAITSAVQKKRGNTDRGNAGKNAKPADAGDAAGVVALLPRRTLLDHVTWVQAKGARDTLDADAQLGADGFPDAARVSLTEGKFAGAKAAIERQGSDKAWNVKVEIAGGTIAGQLQLQPGAKDAKSTQLQGRLDTKDVEISALTAPSRTLTGKLEAQTTLKAEFKDPGAIVETMQTQTKFTVRGAVVHGVDLAQAVKTVGMNRGGETRLDTLAGSIATQGRTVHVTNLVATSGALSANGNVTMSPDKALNGRLTVDLTAAALGGAVGVPLVVGGTLDSPSVTLSRSAVVGAAIGTILAPGVGTAGGATLGDKLGQGLKGLFGK